MLLFSLVRTTAADSCGDGNATATAISDAKIMMVFIVLVVLCAKYFKNINVYPTKTDDVFAWKQLKMN